MKTKQWPRHAGYKVQQTKYSINIISDIFQQILQFCNDRYKELINLVIILIGYR